MTESAALVRDLQQEVLSIMMRTEEDSRPDSGTAVCWADAGGVRHRGSVDEPGPDDHRIAHLEGELREPIERERPVALAVATAINGVPEPHETLVIWSAERGGELLAMRMHTILTWDGLLVPGPIGRLDDVERALGPTLVRALRAAAFYGGSDPR